MDRWGKMGPEGRSRDGLTEGVPKAGLPLSGQHRLPWNDLL